ncbi:hypothetical protein KSP39_PZI015974 [Platanthera zijinensis]|uniref:Uncharacterized protein n=1 Tax=Platanthera zijinensis TaxID=2320716 RepID=A0AAP0BA12_9ASPA
MTETCRSAHLRHSSSYSTIRQARPPKPSSKSPTPRRGRPPWHPSRSSLHLCFRMAPNNTSSSSLASPNLQALFPAGCGPN